MDANSILTLLLLSVSHMATISGAQLVKNCNFCVDPNRITNPNAKIIVTHRFGIKFRMDCKDFDHKVRQGVTRIRCILLQNDDYMKTVCGCKKPSPAPTRNPTSFPTTLPDAPIYNISISFGGVDPLFQGLTIPPNAAVTGMWSRLRHWPHVAIHTAVLPDGRIVTYGAPPGGKVQDGRVFVLWDPALGFGGSSISLTSNPEFVDSFCSSATLQTDGNFLISGGGSKVTNTTSLETSILDYRSGSTTRAENLNSPRWYGTMISLPDGRALITGGSAPYNAQAWKDPVVAATNVSSTPEVYAKGQGWKYMTAATSLDAFGAENSRFWYPRQWVTPYGTVFGISMEKMWEMNVQGEGQIKTLGNFKSKPNNITKPNVGPSSTATMYDTGKILQVGGNGYSNGFRSASSKQATIFDINQINVGIVNVTETATMKFPRQWANSVVLPNGDVLVTGGTRFADNAGADTVLKPEIWNPTTGTWTTGAPAAVYRGYHSSAALLPNGAVFSAGGGIPGPVTNRNAELYYPPYFFRQLGNQSVLADRPQIISVSTNVLTYDNQMQIQVSTGHHVAEASLISLPVVTHSFNSNQRRVRLVTTAANAGATVTMPANANLAPPGYYYVSIVNSVGVPSNAVIISLDAIAPPIPKKPMPADIIGCSVGLC